MIKLSTHLAAGMVALVLSLAAASTLLTSRDMLAIIAAWILLPALFVALATCAAARVLSRKLSASLVQMTTAMEAFGRGEQLAVPVNAAGEIGALARAFEHMACEIKAGAAKIKAYARRERFYIAAVESSNYAFITAAPDATITAWNSGAETMFGYSAEEAVGRKLSLIIPNDKREEANHNRDTIQRLERIRNLETVRVSKDGRRIDVVIDGSPIGSRSDGLLGSSIICRDVSEEKLAQEMFQLAVEACPSGMIMFDTSGKIVMVNTEAERLFGYSRDELINTSVHHLAPDAFPAQRTILREPTGRHAPETGPRAARDLFGRRKDGSEFPIEVGINPIKIRDGMLFLSVVVDVSERRQNERLKDEFVSTVSHELRTPLTSIAGSLGLLVGGATGSLPDPTTRLLAIAHSNSERLVRLINDILDIEKMESGKIVFDITQVDLVELAQHAIDANRGYAENYGVKLRIAPGPLAAFVRADPDRLIQVITNLLSNAIKFSPRDREVVLAIEDRDDNVRLTVRDHGIGIPDSFKPRLFEKFAQADATDTRRKGGTGLGLSIVKQIVILLGGAVGFETPPDGGTMFHVELQRWNFSSGSLTTSSDAAAIERCPLPQCKWEVA